VEPSSFLLYGDDRTLLNWVAYAIARTSDPEFLWTDVRLKGEVLAPTDLLSRNLVPADRLRVLNPADFVRAGSRVDVAVSTMIRSDDAPDLKQQLLDFLRLPLQAQEMLSQIPPSDRPRVVVLSNGHRLLPYFPSFEVAASTVRAFVGTGVSMLVTFADAVGEGRLAFDRVVRLTKGVRVTWRPVTIETEKGPLEGPFRMGSVRQLSELDEVASVLAGALG